MALSSTILVKDGSGNPVYVQASTGNGSIGNPYVPDHNVVNTVTVTGTVQIGSLPSIAGVVSVSSGTVSLSAGTAVIGKAGIQVGGSDISLTNAMPVQSAGGIAADFSASAPAINTLGTLLATIPVNASRRGAFVQNQSTAVIYVVLDDGASGTPTIIALDAGAGVGRQGGGWDTSALLHTGRIRVYGTTGSQIAAGQI